ncbi:hypothetical protein POM88_023522 [Heracleum sosnowskyi]|uniref:Uncharacterized protein n=1 Tax=Heracleum sosnowskyi TaxID=360622 RepID=A0AAD8MV19_9APIA|nr:hypothetical protein POM88_023522 [Heracleum sosnowskyi]
MLTFLLKQSQYTSAVDKEDYENAVRLHVAITSATQNDVVGKVMSKLNKAIEEGRFEDATFLRDNTDAGLVILKRRVAMTRAHGNISGAIEKLNQYLEINLCFLTNVKASSFLLRGAAVISANDSYTPSSVVGTPEHSWVSACEKGLGVGASAGKERATLVKSGPGMLKAKMVD